MDHSNSFVLKDVVICHEFRYMWLMSFGGVYMDLDMACLRPFDDSLLFGNGSAFYIAPHFPTSFTSRDFEKYSNAFMAAPSGHACTRDQA